ncbi:hypothetical protein BLA6992_01958 [Burkholderia lata]|nr:hypothetical protein BLA6992_01958 [Burkholderia lata]
MGMTTVTTTWTRSMAEEGELQLVAGVALITASKLLGWNPGARRFKSVDLHTFTHYWESIDEGFGRVILWNAFSTGAEYLFKGFLMANGLEMRDSNPQKKLHIPAPGALQQWIDDVWDDPDSNALKTMDMPYFGTFKAVSRDRLTNASSNYAPPFGSPVYVAFEARQRQLFAAKTLLQNTIRNRDAHAYVPNVRDTHITMVDNLFLHAFNSMLEWLPVGVEQEIAARLENTAYVRALPST